MSLRTVHGVSHTEQFKAFYSDPAYGLKNNKAPLLQVTPLSLFFLLVNFVLRLCLLQSERARVLADCACVRRKHASRSMRFNWLSNRYVHYKCAVFRLFVE